MRKIPFALTVIALLLTQQTFAQEQKRGGGNKDGAATAPLVEVLTVKLETSQNRSEYAARIEAAHTASHLAPFPGKVEKRLVGPGEMVKRGQDVLLLSRSSMGQDYGDYRAKANITGRVHVMPVDPGSEFNQSALLFTVVDSNSKVVKLLVSDRDIDSLRVGSDVAITVNQTREAGKGRVKTVAILPKDMTGLFPVEIDVSGLSERSLGMMSTVAITGPEVKGFVVPVTAVSEAGGSHHVFVVSDEDKIHLRAVEISVLPGGDYMITGGVKDGERIVRFITDQHADGVAVRVRKSGGRRGS